MKYQIRGKLYPGDRDVWYALGSAPGGPVSIGDEVELYDVENGVSVNLRTVKGTKCGEDCWCYKHIESSSCRSIFGCPKPIACVRVVIVGDLMEDL